MPAPAAVLRRGLLVVVVLSASAVRANIVVANVISAVCVSFAQRNSTNSLQTPSVLLSCPPLVFSNGPLIFLIYSSLSATLREKKKGARASPRSPRKRQMPETRRTANGQRLRCTGGRPSVVGCRVDRRTPSFPSSFLGRDAAQIRGCGLWFPAPFSFPRTLPGLSCRRRPCSRGKGWEWEDAEGSPSPAGRAGRLKPPTYVSAGPVDTRRPPATSPGPATRCRARAFLPL